MDQISSDSLTLLHFGDLHLWRVAWDGEFDPKRFLGLANLLLRRGRKFPESVARLIIGRLAVEEADYLLFSGDLTTTSLKQEFLAAQTLLRPVLDRWNDRFLSIPGNHDRYTVGAARGRHFEVLFCSDDRALSCAIDLNQYWTLVGLDCSKARRITSRGYLSPENLARIDRLLAEQQERGRRLIVMGHYPLLYPDHHVIKWHHALPERAALLEVLRVRGVRLYLHGHVHRRWRLEADGLTLLNCGSAGMTGHVPERRPGYLRIQLGPENVNEVQSVWLDQAHNKGEPAPWANAELPAQKLV